MSRSTLAGCGPNRSCFSLRTMAGLTNADVAASTAIGLNGLQITALHEADRTGPVIGRLRMEERARLDDLRDLYVYSSQGTERVPLRQVASLGTGMRQEKIVRRNQFRTITVGAFPRSGVLASEVMALSKRPPQARGRSGQAPGVLGRCTGFSAVAQALGAVAQVLGAAAEVLGAAAEVLGAVAWALPATAGAFSASFRRLAQMLGCSPQDTGRCPGFSGRRRQWRERFRKP